MISHYFFMLWLPQNNKHTILKFVAKDAIDSNPALVQRFGNKPLSEPMLTWFTDVYMGH